MKNKFERDLDEEIPEEIWYHINNTITEIEGI